MIKKKIYNGRMFIISEDSITIPSQLKYYDMLYELDKYKSNIPTDIIKHSNHCLSFNIEGLEFSTKEVSISKVINKSLALLRKFKTCRDTDIKNLPYPDLYKIYYGFMKDILIGIKYNSIPCKYWIVNGETLEDLFNTKMYLDLLFIIKERMNNFRPIISHGNMYLDNLANQNNNLIVINPKTNFGNGVSILGDIRCDVAKMRIYASNTLHSILNNNFRIIEDNDNALTYVINQDIYYKKMLEYLDSKLKECTIDFNEILIFQACIYLTYIDRVKNTNQKKLLYFEALKIFNDVLPKMI